MLSIYYYAFTVNHQGEGLGLAMTILNSTPNPSLRAEKRKPHHSLHSRLLHQSESYHCDPFRPTRESPIQ
ncbi:hypothetical protein CR513_26951, partial [Mucuna pruriens]